MKPLIVAFSSMVFLIGLMHLSTLKIPVKYSQIFAEKKITLIEELSLFESLALNKKKGFICYE